MTSSRLPGKVLADVAGRPLLDHVVRRVQRARTIDLTVVATTERTTDDAVADFCGRRELPCFRGSEEDVLDRYYRAAVHFQAAVIIRLTADRPLLDPAVIDRVVEQFQAGDYDYVSNSVERSFPDGLDTEVFRRAALDRAWREASLKSEREHVTPYIWKNPGLFRLGQVKNGRDLSSLRWTVDLPQDLDFVRRVYESLGANRCFGMEEVLTLLQASPELGRINAGIGVNEGYIKSLREDGVFPREGRA